MSSAHKLLLDDFGLASLYDQHKRDLLEILDDRSHDVEQTSAAQGRVDAQASCSPSGDPPRRALI